ncbi:MAG: T9SS type A sorting domain-containing protein [Bacteroidetes bacterium]|nr:MAG: T9SS type A sorting domain-containing protein [Bacteroidota bacterium]
MKIRILLFFYLLLNLSSSRGQIVINEIMSNNISVILDEDEDYSDWIELYNAGSSAVNLNNYALSDDIDSLSKWTFPSRTLNAGSFLTIWCSGKNKKGSILHSNFSIKASGETIFLSDNNGTVIENIALGFLPADQSFGRITDGNSTLAYLSHPTFSVSNNSTSIISGAISSLPEFSIPGGMYANPQIISLSCTDPGCVVRYTTDGSEPTENSPAYTNPILVQSRVGEANYYSAIRTTYALHSYIPPWNPPLGEVYKCNIIRARIFKNGYFPGPIQTYSYFIDPGIFTRYGNLPVLSLVSDPKHLFNDTSGIYVPGLTYQTTQYYGNYYKGWKKPVNIEMYNPGGHTAFNGNFKLSIAGESTQSSPQKGLNINASSDYGMSKITYPIFENTEGKAKYLQEFDKIKIRSWGSVRGKTLIQDAFCNSFMTETNLDYAAYRPCVVFINGEYWGFHEIRERNRNEDYYESHYFVDKNNPGFDILNGGSNAVAVGDAVHWDNMMNFMNTNPINDSANYAYVKTQMDMENFMLYYMFSIYFSRGDWPDQNEAKWRIKTPGSKWKWIQWDMDNTVADYLNPWFDTFEQALVGNAFYGPSDILVKLIQNQEFENNFINLFADYMNSAFLPPVAKGNLNKITGELLPYMQEYQDRWQLNYRILFQLDSMAWWLEQRPGFVKEDILNDFGISDTLHITLNVSDTSHGNIKINTLLLDYKTKRVTASTYPWRGTYFENVPFPLTAIAKPGYRFIKWLPGNDTSTTIFCNLTQDTSLVALFDIDTNYIPKTKPVINELMSNNTSTIADNYSNYDDWLEIYNPGNDTIDLAGYFLTDNLVMPARFMIGAGSDSTKIGPQQHLLIWLDNDTEQGRLHASFKLNSSGDFIALIDPDGETVVDSVRFGPLGANVSFGRRYDGAPQYINFNVSTPEATNWIYTFDRIVINELQTGNSSTVQDNFGEYEQWIELYNINSDTIDIAGWRITNDPAGQWSYFFPQDNDSTKIPPYGFAMLWADSQVHQGFNHLNFTLSSSGCLSLIKPNNQLDDSVCYSGITLNQSHGRITDGDPLWMNFSIPTPDSNNVDLSIGIQQIAGNKNLICYPNPVGKGKIYFNRSITFNLYDALGRNLAFIQNSRNFDFSGLENGVYFLRTIDGEFVKIIRQ